MEIRDNRLNGVKGISSTAISVGEVFYGDIDGSMRLLVKTHAGFVDLENPRTTWSNWSGYIKSYQPVKAHVVVEDKQ